MSAQSEYNDTDERGFTRTTEICCRFQNGYVVGLEQRWVRFRTDPNAEIGQIVEDEWRSVPPKPGEPFKLNKVTGYKNTFDVLRKVVSEVSGKPGWYFNLVDDEEGFRLRIADTKCIDAYTRKHMPLAHLFPVPVATYNEQNWKRWVFECCRGVENHELGEWIRWGDERPFAPLHGPGENPYLVREFRDDLDRRTKQDGSVRGEVAAGTK